MKTMQTNPESAAVEAVAWLVTNGGETCEPWLVYERNEVEALPASCIADPLYPQSALDALRGEVAAAERRVAELEKLSEAVTWFDWSDNDEDAVQAIDSLRNAIEEKRAALTKESP